MKVLWLSPMVIIVHGFLNGLLEDLASYFVPVILSVFCVDEGIIIVHGFRSETN